MKLINLGDHSRVKTDAVAKNTVKAQERRNGLPPIHRGPKKRERRKR